MEFDDHPTHRTITYKLTNLELTHNPDIIKYKTAGHNIINSFISTIDISNKIYNKENTSRIKSLSLIP